MNTPPLFAVCYADSGVQSVLGDSDELRLYPFEYAEQENFNLAKPYAVWQTISGTPLNCLGARPNGDNVNLQIDVYADSVESCREARNAIEYAIELNSYVTTYATEQYDANIMSYRSTFGVDWIVAR